MKNQKKDNPLNQILIRLLKKQNNLKKINVFKNKEDVKVRIKLKKNNFFQTLRYKKDLNLINEPKA